MVNFYSFPPYFSKFIMTDTCVLHLPFWTDFIRTILFSFYLSWLRLSHYDHFVIHMQVFYTTNLWHVCTHVSLVLVFILIKINDESSVSSLRQ